MEKSDKKSLEKVESEKVEQENLKVTEKTDRKVSVEKETTTNGQFEGDKNFRIKLEFDPMSIALFALAVVTRFYKLSEPKNVV